MISRGQRHPIDLSLENTIISQNEEAAVTLEDTLKSSTESSEELEFNNFLEQSSLLSSSEKDFIILRLEGMNMDEISKDLQTSAYKIRDNLREKIEDLLEEAKA